MDLALNNLQRLICHKPHQTKPWFNFGDLVGIGTLSNVLKIFFELRKINLLIIPNDIHVDCIMLSWKQ